MQITSPSLFLEKNKVKCESWRDRERKKTYANTALIVLVLVLILAYLHSLRMQQFD